MDSAPDSEGGASAPAPEGGASAPAPEGGASAPAPEGFADEGPPEGHGHSSEEEPPRVVAPAPAPAGLWCGLSGRALGAVALSLAVVGAAALTTLPVARLEGHRGLDEQSPLREEAAAGLQQRKAWNSRPRGSGAWAGTKPARRRQPSPGIHKMYVAPGRPLGTPSSVVADGYTARMFLLYMPKSYRPGIATPLWVGAPGSGSSALAAFHTDRYEVLAEWHRKIVVVLQGQRNTLNVFRNAQAYRKPHWPDDVEYTKAVLRKVFGLVNVDTSNVHCVGFSRGARFCSRLASELSSFFTSIVALSGIRYPYPNNATRTVPILAVHATGDLNNPYNGGGMSYWDQSVPYAIKQWAAFNGCTRLFHREFKINMTFYKTFSAHKVTLFKHWNCTGSADIVLYTLQGGCHTCVLSWNWRSHMLRFFAAHSDRAACHTAVPGERCYDDIMRVRRGGIARRPVLYRGLKQWMPLEHMQAVLHRRVYANCPQPCPRRTKAAKAAALPTGLAV